VNAPEWDAASEAMLHLNDIEAMQGGANGPTIRLRAAIEALRREMKDTPLTDQNVSKKQKNIDTSFNVYWSAVFKDEYCGCGECKSPIGHGRTEQEAIEDLLEQE
jgi:hypothetical protein